MVGLQVQISIRQFYRVEGLNMGRSF